MTSRDAANVDIRCAVGAQVDAVLHRYAFLNENHYICSIFVL
jgi:hypothetical protein